MRSRLMSPPVDPHDISALAPDSVVTDADVAAKLSVPTVDTTFRAVSNDNVMQAGVRPSLKSRVMRGVLGMVVTACLAGLAVFWQSRGETGGTMIAKWAPPFVLALLTSRQDPPTEQPSAAPAAEETAAPSAPPPPPSLPQNAVDNVNADMAAASSQLQSLTHDLSGLRQDMEQMKADIAELRTRQEQMARKMAKASDPNPRPKGLATGLPPTPPAQPVPVPPRKPPPTARTVQPSSASASAPQREPAP